MANQLQEILNDKQAFRKKLAAKPIAEKLWMLESLSERTLALRPDSSVTAPDAPWPIPRGWRWSRMGDVAAVIGGSTPRTDRPEYFGGDIPWITPADLSKYAEKTISYGARNISKEGLENSGARLLPAGAVLFSTRAPIGYVAIASKPVATNQGFKSFVLRDEVTSDYAFYYLQHARQLAIQMASGTTFLELSGKKAAQIPIPVPPLPEQHRIVAEIEKQFTRLDSGVAALKRVQANLKRYRAAVLKAACSGRLVPTEVDIAKEEGGSVETGEQLLKRILAERRKSWSGRGKYKEPAAPATAGLPALPEGWTWVSLEQLATHITDGTHKTPTYVAEGVPFLSAKDVYGFRLSFDNCRHILQSEHEELRKRCAVRWGNVLITKSGTIGRVAVVETDVEFSLFESVANIPVLPQVVSKFVSIAAYVGISGVFGAANKKGVAVRHLHLEDLRRLPIPLPPLAEQTRIVAEVERRLSVVDELEAVVSANLQRAARLRQAVLQKAFAGGLGRQEGSMRQTGLIHQARAGEEGE
jgi:type I restriction enzyme S subunit